MSKNSLIFFGAFLLVALPLSACQPVSTATQSDDTLATPTNATLINSVSSKVTQASTAVPKISPTPTSASPEAMWTFKTGAAIWGTPAIKDNVVYFGSDDGNLYVVDAQNGQLKWKFLTKGIIRSKPAITDNLVIFASDDGFLYAVDLQSGEQVWSTDIGNFMERDKRIKLTGSTDPNGFDCVQSSPLAVDGLIYIGSMDRNVYALAADSGKITWTFKTGQRVRATPTLADGILYIGSWDKFMYALDLTGQMLWKTPLGGQVQSTALVADGLVFTASRKASVMALDEKTGKRKWEYDYGKNLWVESSPFLKDGVIYIGSSGGKMVLGLNTQTGKPTTFYTSQSFHWSTPTISNDVLFIGGTSYKTEPNKGGLYAFKLVNGKIPDPNYPSWLFPVLERETGEGSWSGVVSSPVVANGIVYFGGLDGSLYALNASQ